MNRGNIFCQVLPCNVVHFLSHCGIYPSEANLKKVFITATEKKQRINNIPIKCSVPAPLKVPNIDLLKLDHASLSDIRAGFRKIVKIPQIYVY
jgi:hypothetical protein